MVMVMVPLGLGACLIESNPLFKGADTNSESLDSQTTASEENSDDPEDMCTQKCGKSCELNCDASQTCCFDCEGSNTCSVSCGALSSCSVDCDDSNVCEATCDDSSSCAVSCHENHSMCAVDCVGGAECVLNCADAMSTCEFTQCDVEPVDCGGDVFVCNAVCP